MNPLASFSLRSVRLAAVTVSLAACSAAGMGSSPNAVSEVAGKPPAADGAALPQPTQSTTRSRGWLSPAARSGEALIYWGNFSKDTITVYSARGVNGKKVGEITYGLHGPERLFVDKKLNLYVTNPGNNTITAYKPGSNSPFLTISDGVKGPTGLTVDAAGTIYCANVGNYTITEYPAGETSPSLTIALSNGPEYLATDASDNLYASVGQEVMEFAPGSTSGTDLGLDVSSPSGLEVDRKGNIIVIDSESTIDYFPAGKTEPSKQIPAYGAFALSLRNSEKQLYVSVQEGADFVIESVAYPKGDSLSDKLTTDAGQWPLAVSPDSALGT